MFKYITLEACFIPEFYHYKKQSNVNPWDAVSLHKIQGLYSQKF